ncbi:alpha/beta hydrolase [Microbacterium sp. H1-D42]|uniref:alpha/beta fold hydrolase n=1 Tax=Microbacterium sp. H1-D42 TaxID=2925844 RepID=UPI001F5328F4|nr:alpha/beta hydrolase [Microbacterium sp. H1-D42]UNK71802.1 alpha/beta hydrolase [Microbacterium sp. H1-D42]
MDTPAFPRELIGESWSPPLPEAPGFEHLMISIPGARCHVAVIGDGNPVVLLHGFPEHWWQWRLIAPQLAARGYRVICPDLRGSGWTAAEAPGMRRETQLKDVVALLDALDVARAHVMSHDMGAISAMQLAYSRPERVRAMVQLAVPPGFLEFTPGVAPAFRHMPALLMHRPPRSMRYLLDRPYVVHALPETVLKGYLVAEERPEVLSNVRALYRGMVIPEALRLMRGDYKRMRLQVPTLFVFGRQDCPFSEKNVRRISRNHERCAEQIELAFVDDAAHFITDDAPDAVAALALDWFARIESSMPRG